MISILIAEDSKTQAEILRHLLDKAGYKVRVAYNGREALDEVKKEVPTMVLTDVIMPEMNGRELAKRLLSIYPGLKRLFMSGYTADVIAHQGVLDEGVSFFKRYIRMLTKD